jgi:hypothetical protein
MRGSIAAALKALAVVAVVGAVSMPAPAAAQQTINFSFGGFAPRTEDARDVNDVLVNDESFLVFDPSGLHGVKFGGEWTVPLGDFFDAAGGIEYFQGSTLAADRLSEFEVTGDPILADLKLRTVPISATFRYLPVGRHSAVQPYIGGGVSIINYRYSENGDFVADDDVTIIHGNFVGSGWKTGPVLLGGVRVPVGAWSVGGELKYQWGVADLPTDQGFATGRNTSVPKIDLGGFTYAITFGVRF